MTTTNITDSATEKIQVSVRAISKEHWAALKVLSINRGQTLAHTLETLIEDAVNESADNKQKS